MSDGALSAISAEEVIEDSCVERADCALTEIVVVGFNLGASVVVRVLDQYLNHVGILPAELSQVLLALEQLVVLHGGDEAIELFLLVSLSVLLHNNGACKVLKKVSSEHCHGFRGVLTCEVMVDALAFVIGFLVICKVSREFLGSTFGELLKTRDEGFILCFRKVFNWASRERRIVLIACGC